MTWVQDALNGINNVDGVMVRPRGSSMAGVIEDNELVTLRSLPKDHRFEVGQVVFVRWKGNYLLHLIKQTAVFEIQIGNNRGKINGWVKITDVIGWCADKRG